MSEHAPRTVERHCDVTVIGGSAAGLAAALQLGRQRRSVIVIVIDAGEPATRPPPTCTATSVTKDFRRRS